MGKANEVTDEKGDGASKQAGYGKAADVDDDEGAKGPAGHA